MMLKMEISLALLLLALCVVLSTQAPLKSTPPMRDTEAAMWSRVQNRRARNDQTVDTPTNSSVQNITTLTNHVPKYISDLYANLTNKHNLFHSTNPVVSNLVNTIRALPTTATSVCGQYNFSLASQVSSQESILHSELHLYKEPKVLSANYKHRVNVYYYSTENDAKLITSRIISSDQKAEEVFDVLSAVQDWKDRMLDNPENGFNYRFQLEIVGESCEDSNLQFVYSENSDTDKQPLLVIYSYDPNTKAIDYQSIVQTPEGQVSAVDTKRRRSADSTPSSSSVQPSCGVHELEIDAGHLESLDFFAGYSIIAPRKYNAGICGGMCQNRYPSTFQHSSFVHLLINTDAFADSDYTFSQNCSPVRYDPIDILMATSNSVVIKRFADMVINRCECIDVVSFE